MLAVVLPFAVAWFVVTALADSFYRPAGSLGVFVWLAQALIAGLSISMTTERFTRKALPLASLFNMTLVFPDQAPSRFGVALRSNTVRKLQSQVGDVASERLGDSAAEAAAAAIKLVAQLGQHDRMTRGHTERVRAHSDLIAEELGLPTAARQKLAWGALLHDIGKVTVPSEILNKETKPTEAEWAILQGHPAASARMLEPLQHWLGEWLLAAPQHHERWDGNGYPLGLGGAGISLAGRIVAVADAYDVMTSRRSYKAPLSPETARKELIRCSGTQFDPDVVRAFLNVSLRRRWLTGPLATLAELPRVVNLGANLPAASAVVAGTIAAVGSINAVPVDAREPELAFIETVGAAEPDESATTVATPDPTAPVPDAAPATEAAPEVVEEVVAPVEEPSDSTLPPSSTIPPASTDGETVPPTTVPAVSSTTVWTPLTTAETTPTTGPGTTTTTLATTTATQPTTTTTLPPTTSTTIATTTSSTLPPGSPAPVADSVTVDEDKDIKINVLDNDDSGNSAFDESTLEIITDPQHADSFRVHNDHIHYKSVKNYDGTDTIEYRICNTNGLCNTAIVTITVEG